MPRTRNGETGMAQASMANFTTRVTRRGARTTKNITLDSTNTNIVSIAPNKDDLLKSPKRLQKAPVSLLEGSPAKVAKKCSEKVEEKVSSRSSRAGKRTPTNLPTETIQETFRKQLDKLKSPVKNLSTPEKFKFQDIDISPPKNPVPTIRRALKFGDDKETKTEKILPCIQEDIKPMFAGQVKRDREISSQPNSPSTSSPMYKKQMTVSAKTILNSPQKAPQSPLCSPRKVDTRTRSQIMLEEIVGKKTGVRNLSKEMLKKQLEKSGKLNELKSKIGEIKDIDARLKAIREKSPKKSTINLKVRPAPTPLDADAPCYVKYRHLADEGVMDKMRLPSHYQLLAEQFETTDSQTATLYNRGEACVFQKIATAVKQVHSKDFDETGLGKIRAVYPECYTYSFRKGLYDAKQGSSRIKSAEYQLVINPLLENDENESESSGAQRMTLKHITKRTKTFRKTLVGIVKALHETFLTDLGIDLSKMKNIKRWHPQFKLEECSPLQPAPLPEKPGSENAPTSAAKLLEMMKDKFPAKAAQKLEARKKELETIELKKIQDKEEDEKTRTAKTEDTPKAKPKIPAHILAKIRAKQAAKAEQECSTVHIAEIENNLLDMLPKAASVIRSYFITEKKTCYPFDSACKKLQKSWKTPLSVAKATEMLEKLHELQPKWLDVRTVVGTKYCKLLDREKSFSDIEDEIKQKIKENQKL